MYISRVSVSITSARVCDLSPSNTMNLASIFLIMLTSVLSLSLCEYDAECFPPEQCCNGMLVKYCCYNSGALRPLYRNLTWPFPPPINPVKRRDLPFPVPRRIVPRKTG